MTYECVGSYASEPYYIDGLCLNIFSIEELCYYIRENTGLMDASIMSPELADFVRNGLKLPELSLQLDRIIRSGGQVSEFVCAILQYACYVQEDELEQIRKAINGSVDIRPGMRRKSRGDFLFENGRYPAAAEEYLQALGANPDDEEGLNAAIYHNLGEVYAEMFLFGNAAESFRKSYELKKTDETLKCFLVASRLTMSSEEYSGFIIREQLAGEMVNEAEKLVKPDMSEPGKCNADISGVLVLASECSKLRADGNLKEYQNRMDALIDSMKAEYRRR